MPIKKMFNYNTNKLSIFIIQTIEKKQRIDKSIK